MLRIARATVRMDQQHSWLHVIRQRLSAPRGALCCTRAALIALALSPAAIAQGTLQFRPLTTVDLAATSVSTSAQFIGTNPSAVAWDGATLIVAGRNDSGATANTGIVRVSNIFGTASSSTPSIGLAFGVTSTANGGGYSGIATSGGKTAAAFAKDDQMNFGLPVANGLALYKADGSLAWQLSLHGSGGADFDPGIGGVGQGVSGLAAPTLRRALADAGTGLWIYTTSTGAILNLSPSATGWRDHAYDPATGDLYARNNNDVTKHVRTGANTFSPNVRIVDVTDVSNVSGQNIEFMDTVLGKFLVYNNRPSTVATPLTAAMKIVDTSGASKAYNLGGLVAASSDGYYDFAWDAANDRLAILDSSNRKVYVLLLCDGLDSDGDGIQNCLESPVCCTGDVTTYCTAGTAVLGCVPQISGVGIPSANAADGFEITVDFVPPQRQGLVFYGFYAASQPWAPFNPSFLCVASPVQRTGAMSSGGTTGQCNGQLSLDFNAWRAANPGSLGSPLSAGQTLRAQGWYRDPVAPGQTNLSNALQFTLCNGSGETVPPVISVCANPATVSTGANNCVGVVPDFRPQVVAADNCTAVSVVQTPPPGATVGIGVIPIVLRARDAFQNAVTCSTTLTIVDSVAPVISSCPALSLTANANCQALLPNFLPSVVATDACSLPITMTQSPVPGTLATLGLNAVTITVTDAVGNTATCSTNLTVLPSALCLLPPAPAGFVAIQPGTFQMGQWGVWEPPHPVTISYPFFMGESEVTVAQYAALMGTYPSFFGGLNNPVEQVSWFNARAYCTALTAQQSGLGNVPPGYQYRLPTEAEWEYACRAGTTTDFNVGSSLSCSQARFGYGSAFCGSSSHVAVRSYPPNAWGLYDMHGNVWEWCLDSVTNYTSNAATDPFFTGGAYRVIRGGSWYDVPANCRSAFRGVNDTPDSVGQSVGFRVVLAPIRVP
jgi:formylglycine-generating enzyme required for sulfatase activity